MTRWSSLRSGVLIRAIIHGSSKCGLLASHCGGAVVTFERVGAGFREFRRRHRFIARGLKTRIYCAEAGRSRATFGLLRTIALVAVEVLSDTHGSCGRMDLAMRDQDENGLGATERLGRDSGEDRDWSA